MGLGDNDKIDDNPTPSAGHTIHTQQSNRVKERGGERTGALRGGGGAKRCDATTSWHEQRGGVKDGCVLRLPDEM